MKPDVRNLIAFMLLAGEATREAPIELMHKYLIRNESYNKFIGLIDSALPNDMFGDDDWIDEFKKTIKNKEFLHKFEELIGSFDTVRTFMRENKMFDKMLCGYPDPEVDAKILERYLNVNDNEAD